MPRTSSVSSVSSVFGSILEGLDEILTMVGLGLPPELRRSLAGTNIIASMNGGIRQVHSNVKRWRDARMAPRWTAAGMFEAGKGFSRIKARRQFPILRQTLIEHREKRLTGSRASHNLPSNSVARASFNIKQDIP